METVSKKSCKGCVNFISNICKECRTFEKFVSFSAPEQAGPEKKHKKGDKFIGKCWLCGSVCNIEVLKENGYQKATPLTPDICPATGREWEE
jgi:hypothetical protein